MPAPENVSLSETSKFRLILVCGAERTGTTLLQRLLCGAPHVIPVVGELPIINMIVDSLISARSNYDFFYSDYLNDCEDLNAVAIAAVTNLVRAIRRKYPDRAVGVLKAPGFTPQLPVIRELLPMAHFVVLRRNPLDTIVSMDRVARRARASGAAPFMAALSGDVEALTRRFLSFYTPLLSLKSSALSPITFVKYETLVTRPDEELSRLGYKLNLALSPAGSDSDIMHSTYLQERRDERHRPYWSELYRAGISASRVHTFGKVLSRAQQSAVLNLTVDYRKWAKYV